MSELFIRELRCQRVQNMQSMLEHLARGSRLSCPIECLPLARQATSQIVGSGKARPASGRLAKAVGGLICAAFQQVYGALRLCTRF